MEELLTNKLLQAFEAETGITHYWRDGGPLDGYLELNIAGQRLQYVAEIKTDARTLPYQLAVVAQQEPVIVLARQIPKKTREQLQDTGIAYIEENGNAFIKHNYIHIHIEGKKTIQLGKEKGNRAFTKTGLKVLFQLLQNPNLINRPQRFIAEEAAVALGNIPHVIDGLIKTRFLIQVNKDKYVWEDRKQLLDKWIENYELILKPKLAMGNFTCKTNWRQIEFHKQKTVWGGEPAADLLTDYLRAEKLTIYTKEERNDLINHYRIIPEKNGKIAIYKMFWQNTNPGNTAPPIIVFADLINEGGKRNKETAERIYNEHIQPNL